METNRAAMAMGSEESSISYNEINFMVQGPAGIVGVFARSWRAEHLLLAMGVRSLLSFAFPELQPLPLLVLTSEAGAVKVPRRQQLELIQQHAAGAPLAADAAAAAEADEANEANEADDVRIGGQGDQGVLACTARAALELQHPRLPVDLRSFPEVGPQEAIAFHVAYGATHQSLRAALAAVAHAPGPNQLEPLVHLGLAAAAAVDNAPSARELVRCTAPLLLMRPPTTAPAPLPATAATAVAVLAPHPLTERRRRPSLENALSERRRGLQELAAGLRGGLQGELPKGLQGELQTRGADPPEGEMSRDMMVAVGAQVMLEEFVSGSTTARLQKAVTELDEWVSAAQRCSLSSLAFVLRSWQEAKRTEPDSELLSFMSAKAVTNRRKFCQELRALQRCSDGVEYCRQLRAIVGTMRRPGLRLRLLQMVLGLDRLDGAFSRDVVRLAAGLQPAPCTLSHPLLTQSHTNPHPQPNPSTSATRTPPPPRALSRSMASSALRATSSRACRAKRGHAPSSPCGGTAAMAVRSPAPTHPSPDRTTLTPTSSPSPLHLHSCPVLAIAPAPGLGPHFLTPQAHPIFTRRARLR